MKIRCGTCGEPKDAGADAAVLDKQRKALVKKRDVLTKQLGDIELEIQRIERKMRKLGVL